MELLESKCLESDVVELLFEDSNEANSNWLIGQTVNLYEENGSYYLKQDTSDLFAEVSFKQPALAIAVSNNVSQSVCCVACYKTGKALAIKFVFILNQYNEDVTLLMDQVILDRVSKLDPQIVTFDEAKEWTNQQFKFKHDSNEGLLIEFLESPKNSLMLVGRNYKAIVEKVKKQWMLTAIRPFNGEFDSLYLFNGKHNVIFDSIENRVKNNSYNTAFEQHLKDSGSYFNLWNKYSELHWQQHSRLAKSAGFLEFSKTSPISDQQLRFKFLVNASKLKQFIDKYKVELELLGDTYSLSDVELQVDKDLPEWLVPDETNKTDKSNSKPLFLSQIEIQGDYLIANTKRMPPQKGFAFLSLNGVLKQHERKKNAFNLLKRRRNPLKQLNYILEGVLPPEMRVNKIRAVTSQLKKSLKGKSLTSKQEKALKVALNTPDIALIIGPPGTGKTQVISAIQQRIAEEGDKKGTPIQHQILLSSYQHDAVDNVVARAGVFGLPAIKVGGKLTNTNVEQDTSFNVWINELIVRLAPTIEKEIADCTEYQLVDELINAFFQIKLSKTPAEIASLLAASQKSLDRLSIDYGISISISILQKFENLEERFSKLTKLKLEKTEKAKIYKATLAIRTSDVSFSDDGVTRVTSLIGLLNSFDVTKSYSNRFQNLLDNALTLIELKELKDTLLDDLKDIFVLPNQRWINGSESQTLTSIIDELELSMTSTPRLGQLYFRKKYLDSLLFSKRQVKASLTDYSSVLGATCQQAAGDAMVGIKSVENSNNITFNSVIVDEAARANPLDLMIPMSMAQRRVVLVGDHRQLPHMLEPRVEKELQDKDELEITDQELLKQSLFERLYHTLTKFELDGESDHKRVVMLDTQFRMHPVLGDFISKEFYEPFDLPALKSGLDQSHFPLDVPGYEGKLAAWLHVGQELGRMKSQGGSKYRKCEAEIVAEEAFKILTARPDLSVGIITFYAAQRDLIIDEMIEKGVMENTSEGIKILDGFAVLPNKDERFRVGSVDAFQGKEFDVVLLSTVRGWSKPEDLSHETVNEKLGFLRIPNRINVAMSRQKRLLIVIGDKSLASPVLEQFLPNTDGSFSSEKILVGFPYFYKHLCEGEFGIVL